MGEGKQIEADKKSTSAYSAMLLIYIVFTTASWEFNIYKTEAAAVFSNFVASIIPSLHETAAISKNKDFAQFVLATSWAYMPIAWVIIISRIDWQTASERYRTVMSRKPSLVKYVLPIFLPAMLIPMLYAVPSVTDSHVTRPVFYGIRDSLVFLVVFGFSLWAAGAFILHGITVTLYTYLFDRPRGKK